MFQLDEAFAHHLDAADPLTRYRDAFHLPRGTLYFCTHSLGLLPKAARSFVDQELTRWADLGVEGHFQGEPPWYTYQESLRPALARLIGAQPAEVVLMNGLTVNLHLMLETFYRPTAERLPHPARFAAVPVRFVRRQVANPAARARPGQDAADRPRRGR